MLNNSKNQFIEVFSNQILYEFNVRDFLNLLIKLFNEDRIQVRNIKQIKAEIFIVFVNAMIKTKYDNVHTRIDRKILIEMM